MEKTFQKTQHHSKKKKNPTLQILDRENNLLHEPIQCYLQKFIWDFLLWFCQDNFNHYLVYDLFYFSWSKLSPQLFILTFFDLPDNSAQQERSKLTIIWRQTRLLTERTAHLFKGITKQTMLSLDLLKPQDFKQKQWKIQKQTKSKLFHIFTASAIA